MKLTQILAIAMAGGLLAASRPAGAAVFTSFSGDLSPANWTQPTAGTAGFSPDYSTLTLFASTGTSPSDVIVSCSISQSFSMNISWTLLNNGDSSGQAIANYYVDGNLKPYTPGDESITISSDIPGSHTIAFELSSSGTVGTKSPAELEISFTDFTPVPEPGTWSLAGGILLGAVYLLFVVIKQVRLRRSA